MSEVARILDGHGSLLLHCSRLITRLLLTLPELLRSARGRVILRLVIIILSLNAFEELFRAIDRAVFPN